MNERNTKIKKKLGKKTQKKQKEKEKMFWNGYYERIKYEKK